MGCGGGVYTGMRAGFGSVMAGLTWKAGELRYHHLLEESRERHVLFLQLLLRQNFSLSSTSIYSEIVSSHASLWTDCTM